MEQRRNAALIYWNILLHGMCQKNTVNRIYWNRKILIQNYIKFLLCGLVIVLHKTGYILQIYACYLATIKTTKYLCSLHRGNIFQHSDNHFLGSCPSPSNEWNGLQCRTFLSWYMYMRGVFDFVTYLNNL